MAAFGCHKRLSLHGAKPACHKRLSLHGAKPACHKRLSLHGAKPACHKRLPLHRGWKRMAPGRQGGGAGTGRLASNRGESGGGAGRGRRPEGEEDGSGAGRGRYGGGERRGRRREGLVSKWKRAVSKRGRACLHACPPRPIAAAPRVTLGDGSQRRGLEDTSRRLAPQVSRTCGSPRPPASRAPSVWWPGGGGWWH